MRPPTAAWATPRSLALRVERAFETAAAGKYATKKTTTTTAAAAPRTAAAPTRCYSQNHRAHPLSTYHQHRARRPLHTTARRAQQQQPGDDPTFTSIVDNPPELVRAGSGRGGKRSAGKRFGLALLFTIPATAFALGTWQVQRLGWKTELLASLEDRVLRDPLELPLLIDPEVVADEFDYRRVRTFGLLRHDLEMLVGPRVRDGEQGYMVITPLQRSRCVGFEDGSDDDDNEMSTAILVNRGWISKAMRDRRARHPDALPRHPVEVEGLLREPWRKNMFTPDNRPDKGEFYFPDVHQMAALTGTQPIWVEQTMEPDLLEALSMERKGMPIGRPAEVNIRNNHAQYIFTWYGLAIATSIMFYMVVRKPPTDIARRVRQNKDWS